MVDTYKAVAAKKETTYASDAGPTMQANAILTRNFSGTPIEVDQLDRKLDLASRGAVQTLPSNERQRVSFEVELTGSGAAGTAAPWMELLQGCAMNAPVLTANTSAQQAFAAPGSLLSSLSLYWWRGGNQLRRCKGARGDITAIDFTAGAYPFLAFAFTGLLGVGAEPPVTTNPTGVADYSRWQQPLEVNLANTGFSLGGYAARMRSLKLQANAAIAVRNLVNARYVQRGNHALKGKLVIEAPTQTDRDFFSNLRTGLELPLALSHGTVAGNIVQLIANSLQILAIAESEEDDVLMYECDVQLNIDAGSDDLFILTR